MRYGRRRVVQARAMRVRRLPARPGALSKASLPGLLMGTEDALQQFGGTARCCVAMWKMNALWRRLATACARSCRRAIRRAATMAATGGAHGRHGPDLLPALCGRVAARGLSPSLVVRLLSQKPTPNISR